MAAKIQILYKSASIDLINEQSEECAFSGQANLLAWRGKDRENLDYAREEVKKMRKK